MSAFADRLADAVRRKGPLCVGLDPRWESLPKAIRDACQYPPVALQMFGRKILELVEPFAGVVKPQAAFFEWFGPDGMTGMQELLRIARGMGFVTILDAKRGDIASTAEAYAHAAFGPTWDADSLTINPYLGRDAVEPFLSAARAAGRGVFVLVRTSNPGAGLFQNLVCDGKPLYRHVADEVVKGRWSGRRTRGNWPSCGWRCRTSGSWCRATGRRAGPPRTCGRRSGPTGSGRWSTARAG